MVFRDGEETLRDSEEAGLNSSADEPRSESEELPDGQRHDDAVNDVNEDQENDETDQHDDSQVEGEPDTSARDPSRAEAANDSVQAHDVPDSAGEREDDPHAVYATLPLHRSQDIGGSTASKGSARIETDTAEPDVESMDATDLRKLVYQMRIDHEQQLQAEERARSEVEDMCLRIEKHFKSEKAARAKAEELMQQAIENELAIKSQLDMEHQRLNQVDNEIELERDKVRHERDALEAMRLEFEHELQQAQAEVAKAQDALKSAEDRVRATEQVERQKIISDYEMRLMALANELVRANNETQLRTSYMSREVARYQSAAAASANAMALAKREMHDRRADVDAMRTKLDSVMERLFTGSQANMILQANMTAGQEHAGQLFADPQAMTAAGLATLMPGAKFDMHSLTQPLLLGATATTKQGMTAGGSAGIGKLTVMDHEQALCAGGYSGNTNSGGAGKGGKAPTAAEVPKRGGGGGGAGKTRQLPPLQSGVPGPSGAQARYQETTTRSGGAGNGKGTRRKGAATVHDRFNGAQVKAEYIMAETMAHW